MEVGGLFQSMRRRERGLILSIGLLCFAVLNVVVVWPQIRQLGPLGQEMGKLQTQLEQFQREVSNAKLYQQQLIELQSKTLSALPAERSTTLLRLVQELSRKHNLTISSSQPVLGRGDRTNELFEEESIRLTYEAQPEGLVGFLYELAQRYSMVLVRSLEIRPAPRRYTLQGTIEIVAFYRKEKANPKTEKRQTNEVAWAQ